MQRNGNQYLSLVPTDESKDKLKKVWRTMEQNQSSYKINKNNSDNYDEKYEN